MLMFIALFGVLTALTGLFLIFDQRRAHKDKLERIQRELARRDAANSPSPQSTEAQE